MARPAFSASWVCPSSISTISIMPSCRRWISPRIFQIGAKPEGIMSLKEFLEAYRKRCRLLLEIKNRDWETVSRHEMKVRKTLEMAGARCLTMDPFWFPRSISPAWSMHINTRPDFPLIYNFETDQTFADAQRASVGAVFPSRVMPADQDRWMKRLVRIAARSGQMHRGLHLQQRCGDQHGAGAGRGYLDQRCAAKGPAIESHENGGRK